MMSKKSRHFFGGGILFGGLILTVMLLQAQMQPLRSQPTPQPQPTPEKPIEVDMKNPIPAADQMIAQRLFKDAYDLLGPWAQDTKNDPKLTGEAFKRAVSCLNNLNRANEIDEYFEKSVELQSGNWRFLWAAADAYSMVPYYGFRVDGKYVRGPHRGGGEYMNSMARDRVRALQLLKQAMPLADKDDNKADVAAFYNSFAAKWLSGRSGDYAWMLQSLTDLETLPDCEPGYRSYSASTSKAPVDDDGNPIYYKASDTFENAKNDGERWLWCLNQAVENDAKTWKVSTILTRARFLQDQFGVQTMREYNVFFNRPRGGQSGDKSKEAAGTWELHTLKDNETIAKLASGVKRFELPDDQNFIKLFEEAYSLGTDDEKVSAGTALANVYSNRRIYPKSVEWWNKLLTDLPLYNERTRESWKNAYEQIVKNWGRFEATSSKSAGKGMDLQYLFRNGKSVKLSATEIKIPELINDVKEYVRSKPNQFDWNKLQIDGIGYQLVQEKQQKYLGRKVADWVVDLEPAANHFDRRITITTPMTKAGAYLVKAEMNDGNEDFIIVWLDSAGIVKKNMDEKAYYFVGDADTGAPLKDMKLDFFGYRITSRNNNTTQTEIKEFTQNADANAQVVVGNDKQNNQFQWLVTASDGKDKFAYLGFRNIWYNNRYDAEYNETKAFFISDRPVYRPKDTVEFKFWLGTAKYDLPDVAEMAGKEVLVEMNDPRGEKILEKKYKLDEYGGLADSFELKTDATLGQYYLTVMRPDRQEHYGSGYFRIEEYKKPEYEVSVEAPKDPVALGDKFNAKIKAKYYFGSPVTEATVKYKVTRETHNANWYPYRPWDWFYGNGYWWFAYDYDWYPGFGKWGCRRPISWWMPARYSGPPELVMEKEVKIGEDGTVDVEIDTSFVKEIFPDDDQKYTITAEVVDNSRRTIVGTGTVLVAKEPFKVYTWVDRGYYEPNQQIKASFQTKRLDGKPVIGDAEVKLFRISYDDGKPVETEVSKATVKLNEEGAGNHSFSATQPGQYRVSCSLDSQEGGYIFSVYGPKQNVGSFEFNELELVPSKAEFAPGEKVQLRVNTTRVDSTVLLFLRPTNGVYLPPQILRLKGKSELVEFDVAVKDMPNFFIEAVTISGGRVLSETKEIVVPPEKRVLNVAVEPSSEAYKPGEKAKARLVVTDLDGKPVVGSVVVSIYDKSVEYISGGSNVGDIKEFFWKWRRHHYSQTESTLGRMFGNMTPPNKPGMQFLGVFGASVADEINYDGKFGVELGMQNNMLLNGIAPMRSMARGSVMAGRAPMKEMDMAATPMMAKSVVRDEVFFNDAEPESQMATGGGGGELVEAAVRQNFADTAFWAGTLKTNNDGIADIELDMPENLTTWKINVWTMGLGTKVGNGTAEVVTRKDLILRMQTPRFLVQKDKVLLTANVHNYLKTEKNVHVSLELDGKTLTPFEMVVYSQRIDRSTQTVRVPANGEAQINWLVEAKEAGDAVIRMKALTDEESDAMQLSIPVYVHGMLKQEAWSGYIKPSDEAAKVELNVPEERRPEETKLTVRFSPTLAGAMIDALPYLANYPYGCTEQTLNRFLPSVITQKILIDMGVDLKKLEEAHANLNAQELGDPKVRAAQWKRYKENPVFSEDELRKMVEDGVKKLTEMQLSDGGWGWFSGYGEHSYAHMTALVVHGLRIAAQNDVQVDINVINRGVQWLKKYQAEQVRLLKNAELPEEQRKNLQYKQNADDTDAFVFMVLYEKGAPGEPEINDWASIDLDMKDYLWRDRAKLSLYGVSMFGIALSDKGLAADKEKIAMCVKMIEQYLQQDEENQTAYLNLDGYPGYCWWYWYGSEYETHAYYLKLLIRTDPKSEVAPRLVKYLLNNRKHGTYWNSTRDTAICVEAFAEFLKATGEDKPNMTVEVLVDGQLKKTVEITPENLFLIDNTLVMEKAEVSSGKHTVELKKKGTGPLYFNAYLENFTLEDPITKAGLEVKIERRYYLLKRDENATAQVAGGTRGQVVDQKVEKYIRTELKDLNAVKSGDLIEIELVIESKNDYESILIEDMKAAGFEPVDLRSGYNGNALGAYVEFRDERVSFFKQRLMRGTHSVAYRLRAEQPGVFSALPAKIWGMYAPELKGNSDEFKVEVKD